MLDGSSPCFLGYAPAAGMADDRRPGYEVDCRSQENAPGSAR